MLRFVSTPKREGVQRLLPLRIGSQGVDSWAPFHPDATNHTRATRTPSWAWRVTARRWKSWLSTGRSTANAHWGALPPQRFLERVIVNGEDLPRLQHRVNENWSPIPNAAAPALSLHREIRAVGPAIMRADPKWSRGPLAPRRKAVTSSGPRGKGGRDPRVRGSRAGDLTGGAPARRVGSKRLWFMRSAKNMRQSTR
jgi:hypothetical protein